MAEETTEYSLTDLAWEYFSKIESYAKTVCSQSRFGRARPATDLEELLIHKRSYEIRRDIAHRIGICRERFPKEHQQFMAVFKIVIFKETYYFNRWCKRNP